MFRMKVVVAMIAVSGSAWAGNPELLACSSLETAAQTRECMLDQQMANARVAGEQVGGASAQVLNTSLTSEELAALQARQQMAEMVNERDRAALGPVGSDGGLSVFGPLLLLLVLLGASGSGGGGAPISPS